MNQVLLHKIDSRAHARKEEGYLSLSTHLHPYARKTVKQANQLHNASSPNQSMHIHSPLERLLQIIRLTAASSERLLRLGFLILPYPLLVLRDGDVSLLVHLLLLSGGGLRLGLLPNNSAEANDFVVDHPAHFLDVVDDFEVEVEG